MQPSWASYIRLALSYGNTEQATDSNQLAANGQCATVLMIGTAQQTTDIDIQWVADEPALLLALQAWFKEHDPDAVIGWAVG